MESSKVIKGRPIIGLALGGGGARGYAHLGVIKTLQEANIPVDVIAGTSMGALIGAVYATESRVDKAEDIATNIRWGQLLRLADLTIPSRGIIAGNRVEKYFSTLILEREFYQLEKKLVVVATDIRTGDAVNIKSGPVALALRASTALPGIFCPIKLDGRLLVDGTLTTPVPVEAAMEAGAELIIAVNVCSSVDRTDILVQALKVCQGMSSNQICLRLGAPDLLHRLKPMVPESINIVSRSLELHNNYIKNSSNFTPPVHHLLVKPAVDNVRWYEFHRARECIRAGEAAARPVANKINALLKQEALPEEAGINSVVNI
ncbi:MAG: patatin-like phospholipase family protein [Syntrophomonadaceae bacterium]|nr:patatin-like phospholipase family protein [Syntrophomonadaceae bacterium]